MKFPTELLRQCWFLAGPTASGKTATGIALARRIGAEIVSLDSMAVYRGMDIGTAKPTPEEQEQVPHHLVDVVDPHEEFTTAEYLRRSLAACEQIVSRGKVPLFVGGTGLYLRSLLRGVFAGPPADWEFRERMSQQAAERGCIWLHGLLVQTDPITAARLHPHDERRVIRALEIIHITGRPASQQQGESALPADDRPQHVYWLSPPRDWLYDRINRRVEYMLERGLVEEVRRLLACPSGLGQTARQALGYKEVIDLLHGRIASLEILRYQLQTRTRQFAKRQLTWFRNLEECNAMEIRGDESPDALAERLTIRQ